MILRLAPVLVIGLLVGGCATKFERQMNHNSARWDQLLARTDNRASWARCIDERAKAYIAKEKSSPPPIWFKGSPKSRTEVKFTWALADCADKMAGPGWDYLTPEDFEQMMTDAFLHFSSFQWDLDFEDQEKIESHKYDEI
jgi:hypothetical protein